MHPTRSLIGAAIVLGGCATAANTLPPIPTADEPARQYTLYVPEGLEVRHADFDASVFTDASPGTTSAPSEVRGRAFVKVYAVDRRTGDQYLLVYENIDERSRPLQIIRFQSAPFEER